MKGWTAKDVIEVLGAIGALIVLIFQQLKLKGIVQNKRD
jgi:hypothetical protein